ncbi:MAG: hypothetical protein ACRC41_01200 [Sarcina sp.]
MEWNIGNIENIIVKINSMLVQGMTMSDIERNEFNVNARVIHKRLDRLGYKRIENQYILSKNINKKDDRHSVGQYVVHQEEHNIEVLQSNEIEMLFNKNNNIEKLKGLITRYDEIVNFLDKISPVTVSENIIIELPVEEGKKDFKATVRINKLAWEQFNEFCNERKQYSKKDLISQALIEFIRNHS